MIDIATRDAQLARLPEHDEFVRRLSQFDDSEDVWSLIYEPLAQRHAGEEVGVMSLMGSFFSTLMKNQSRFTRVRYNIMLLDGMHRWVELLVDNNPTFVSAFQEQLGIVD